MPLTCSKWSGLQPTKLEPLPGPQMPAWNLSLLFDFSDSGYGICSKNTPFEAHPGILTIHEKLGQATQSQSALR